MTLCLLYVVPFLRYSASNNGVTSKMWVGVIQGHWSYTTFYRLAIVSIAVCCTIIKLFDVEYSWPWKGHWRSLKLVPFERLAAVSYSSSIVTMALSCISSEIKPDIGRKWWFFFHTPPLHSTPRRNIDIPFGVGKLEWWGYPTVKKLWGYV